MLNKKGKKVLSVFLLASVVLLSLIILPKLISSGVSYPSSMSVLITSNLTDQQVQSIGEDYLVLNDSDLGRSQVIFFSGKIAMQDSDGSYQFFTNLTNVTYSNYNLTINYPEASYTYTPYITVNSTEFNMSQFLAAFPEAIQKVYILDKQASFEIYFNLTNISGINITAFRLYRDIGTCSLDDTYYSDNATIQLKYKFDFSDLTNDDFNVSLMSCNNITIENITSDKIGLSDNGTLILDPIVTLQTAGTKNLRDAYVSADSVDSNFGTSQYLFSNNGGFLSYLMFNISGLPQSSIVSASNLSLYSYSTYGTESFHSAYHVFNWTNSSGSEDLNETTITWNSQPCGTSFTNSTFCNLTQEDNITLFGSANKWYNWSVKNAVQTQIGQPNVSLVIRQTNSEDTGDFYSKEQADTSLRPKLIIDYTLGNATNTSCGFVNSDLNLSQNISNPYGDCLIINASDITIDCKGYWINTGSGGSGIQGSNPFNNSTIKNCFISSDGYGIYFYNNSNNTIFNTSSNNVGADVNTWALLFSYNSNNNNISFSNFTSNNQIAVVQTASSANNNNFSNVKVTGSSTHTRGMSLLGNNNLLQNSNISTTGDFGGVSFSGNSSIYNTTIQSGGTDLQGGSGINNATNTTFTSSSSSGTLNVFWYLETQVNTTGGVGLESVNVTAKNNTGNLVNYSLTDSTGLTSRVTLRQYMQNSTSTYYDTNYTINASKSGVSNSTQVNLTKNYVDTDKVFFTLTSAPTITFVSPTPSNATWINTSWTWINVSTNIDAGLCNLTWNGTNETMTQLSAKSFRYNQTVSDGINHYYNATCNDTVANSFGISSTYNLKVDTINPKIAFLSATPANNSYQSSTYVDVQVNVTDVNKNRTILNWTNSSGTTSYDISCTPVIATIWTCEKNMTGLGNGQSTYLVWTNDLALNSNQTVTNYVTIDVNLPTISYDTINTPSDNTFSASDFFLVNVTIGGTNYANHTFYLYNMTDNTIYSDTKTNVLLNQKNWTTLTEGTYKYNVTVCNLADSCVSTSTRTWTYDNTAPVLTYITPPTPLNENSSSRTIQIKINYTENNPSTAFLNFTATSGVSNYNTYNYSPTSGFNNLTFNLYNIQYGNYTFYISMNDTAGHVTNTSTNWTFENATSPLSFLISPADNYVSNITDVNFTCNSTMSGAVLSTLANVSLITNFTGTWQINETINISGVSNSTQFSKTLADGKYLWNCEVCDSDDVCAQSAPNYTLTVDTAYPFVSYSSDSQTAGVFAGNYIFVNITSNDTTSGINDLIMNLNGTNYTKLNSNITCNQTANGYYCFKNFTSLDEKNYTVQGFASDLASWTNNTSVRTFQIDNIGPAISITFPGSEFYTITKNDLPPWVINSTISITDNVPLVNCSYNVTYLDGTLAYPLTYISCSNTSIPFTINTADTYYLNVYANTTNHQTQGVRTFVVSYNPLPGGEGGGGEQPTNETNQTCFNSCGNKICEPSCGENWQVCSQDCSNPNAAGEWLEKNWLWILLLAGIVIALIFLLRNKKKRR